MESPKINNNTNTSTPSRKPYSAPVLELYGDVRDLTLGGTKGTGDTIAPMTKKV